MKGKSHSKHECFNFHVPPSSSHSPSAWLLCQVPGSGLGWHFSRPNIRLLGLLMSWYIRVFGYDCYETKPNSWFYFLKKLYFCTCHALFFVCCLSSSDGTVLVHVNEAGAAWRDGQPQHRAAAAAAWPKLASGTFSRWKEGQHSATIPGCVSS